MTNATNQIDTSATPVVEAVAVPLTRAEKYAKAINHLTKTIEAAQVKLAELQLEADTASKLEGVGEGVAIVARIGRAETSRNVSARVVGVQELDSGSRRFKILFGAGIDTDTAVIQESQIVEVISE